MTRRLTLALLAALALVPVAAPRAQNAGADASAQDTVPPLPAPDPRVVAAAAAHDPTHADSVVSVAAAQDPLDAGTLVAATIAALPATGLGDNAARVAAAAAAAAPQNVADVAGAAVAAVVRAAGKAEAVPPGASPEQAVQAVLNVGAIAAAQATQAVIVAAGNNPDPPVLGTLAESITRRAVDAAMSATRETAAAVATKAGADPDAARALAQQAANLAATTVTKAAIAATTTAEQEAAQSDPAASAALADAAPSVAAQKAASTSGALAAVVTRAAVAAATSQAKDNGPDAIAAASAVTEAASSQTATSVASAASDAASAAGAAPAETQAIAAGAGQLAAQNVNGIAAQTSLAAVPNIDRSTAAAAAGPALAGGIMGLHALEQDLGAVPGASGGGLAGGGTIDAADLVSDETTLLATQLAATSKVAAPPPPPPAPARPSPAAPRNKSAGLLDDPAQFVPYIIALLAFFTVLGLAQPYLLPDAYASRLNAITVRRGELSEERKKRLQADRPSLRFMVSARANFMRNVLEKLNIKNLAEQTDLKKKLTAAGYRSSQAIITFTFLRLALPVAFAGFSALLLFGGSVGMASPLKVIIMMGALLFGYLLPSIMVSNQITKRRGEIQRKFPDALDLMVICIESGISLEAAFSRVSEEMGQDAPTLAEEIAITTAELAFLPQRRMALENLAERAATPGVKSLVTALVQSEKYGTPLGTALRVVAQESRDTRMSRAEEKAAALPAKLTVPMVVFFLPVLFLVLIGPTIVQVMHAFSGG